MIKKILIVFIVALCLFLVVTFIKQFYKNDDISTHSVSQSEIKQSSMKLASAAFTDNTFIQSEYTCEGKNISPPLTISGIPTNTQSLAFIVDDPDATMGTWVHWVVWNIPVSTSEIMQGSIPAGSVEGMTSFGKTGYGGPCPPSGTHRYFFKLYALDTQISLSNYAGKKELEQVMQGHILTQSQLIGLYSKK